jgi:hypothetical protein
MRKEDKIVMKDGWMIEKIWEEMEEWKHNIKRHTIRWEDERSYIYVIYECDYLFREDIIELNKIDLCLDVLM